MLTAAPMPAAYILRRQHFGLRPNYNFIQYLWIITLTLDYYVLSALNTFGRRILTASIVIRFVVIICRTRTDADRAAHGLQPTTATRPAF